MGLRLNVMFDDDDPSITKRGVTARDDTPEIVWPRPCSVAFTECVGQCSRHVWSGRSTHHLTNVFCLLVLCRSWFFFFFQSCLPVWPSSRSQWPLSQHVLWRGFWGVAGLLLGRFWARVCREAWGEDLHEYPHPGHGHSCLRSSRWASGADFGRRVASVSTVSSWRST